MFTYDPTVTSFKSTVRRMNGMLPGATAIREKGNQVTLSVTWEENGLSRAARITVTEETGGEPTLECVAEASGNEGFKEVMVLTGTWDWQPVDMWLNTAVQSARAIHPEDLGTLASA